MLASCSNQQGAMPFEADSTATDSTELRVAVMPAMNCLPLFYAVQSGLDARLGLPIKLLRYQAQMDIDTAILRKHVDIAYTDLIRAERLGKECNIQPFASCNEQLSLICQKATRVKRIDQLKEHMIAVSRLSATDYWCDHILDSAQINHDDIYRPQINDVHLRAEMIRTRLVDAAMMGEPYATWMTQLGHQRLFTTGSTHTRLYAWAACDSLSATSCQAFRCLLDSATTLVSNDTVAATLRTILKREYRIPGALADTIALPAITPTTDIRPSDLTSAQEWLKRK